MRTGQDLRHQARMHAPGAGLRCVCTLTSPRRRHQAQLPARHMGLLPGQAVGAPVAAKP